MEAQQQRQQSRGGGGGRQSDREAEIKQIAACCCWLWILAYVTLLLVVILLLRPSSFERYWLTVHVASLSLSLSPAMPSPSPPPVTSSSVVSGNWSIALSVKNPMQWHRLSWDHTQVMLFYGHEFMAGTFLEKFSVAPEVEGTLETGGAPAFSHRVGEWAARAMAKDREDGGVMELTVKLLRNDDGSRYWFGWDSFICRGLKLGFSRQNQGQVGSLASGPPHKCT